MGTDMTFKELNDKANAFAGFLSSQGLKPKDKIAVMLPNCLQYPIVCFGALRLGLILVNTNPLYTPREMEHQFVDSEANAIVICDMFAANLEKIIEKTQIKTVFISAVDE